MRNVIRQSVVLPADAHELLEMYINPDLHTAITGKPVTIGEDAGAPFEAFDGVLTGTILAVVRPRLIVQSWRSALFHDEDPDSTLFLAFSDEAGGGRVDLVHLDVPDHDVDGVTEGWDKYYWQPWLRYLDGRQ